MHSRSAAAILVALACAPAPTALDPLPAGGVHVLFIGNSLTYVNDLPATVEAIARSAGDTIQVMTVAGAGLALIDHLTGATQAFLAGKPFAVPDTVVRILQTAAHTANTRFPSPVVNRAITPSSHAARVGHC